MKSIQARVLLAAMASAMLLAVSPASAFVAVECTAKNSAGKKFTNEHFGLLYWDSQISAESFAMAACKAGSDKPESCEIAVCTKTHD